MGRRPDPPQLQAAKGHPGKRKTKAERQVEAARDLAGLLAASPSKTRDRLAPPALLNDPRCAPALAVWQEYAPRLSKLNLFDELDRHTFSIFCVYGGEFVEAQRDILDKGYYRRVKTVSGDMMDRINPSVKRRDYAQKVMLELAKRFGLTPIDLLALLRDQASRPPPTDATTMTGTGLVGMLGSFDSAPPGRVQ